MCCARSTHFGQVLILGSDSGLKRVYYHQCRRGRRTLWGNNRRNIHCIARHTSLHCCTASCSCCSGPGNLGSPLGCLWPCPSGQRSCHWSSGPACSPGNPFGPLRHLMNRSKEKKRQHVGTEAEKRTVAATTCASVATTAAAAVVITATLLLPLLLFLLLLLLLLLFLQLLMLLLLLLLLIWFKKHLLAESVTYFHTYCSITPAAAATINKYALIIKKKEL